ncbi:MAG TPA: hypothetical protein VFJ77_02920 [Gaiellaceae bacterium]|nr:hypothetical protein [Gaiellaceae bacterium]
MGPDLVVRRNAGQILVVVLVATASLGFLLTRAQPRHARPLEFPRGTIYAVSRSYGDTRLLCTTRTRDAASGLWRCDGWTVDVYDLPVARPAPLAAPCDRAQVDQAAGRWVCAGG